MTGVDVAALEKAHADALAAACVASKVSSDLHMAEIRASRSLEAAAVAYAYAKDSATQAAGRADEAWKAADATANAMVAAGLPDPRKQGAP